MKLFKVKTLSATNTKSTRVKITNLQTSEIKVLPYNYKYNNSAEIAKNWIENIRYYVTVDYFWSESDKCYYLYTV